MFLPIADAFAGARPEVAGQLLQQIHSHVLQRGAALQALRNQQPNHNQRGVDAVLLAIIRAGLNLIEKSSRKQLLEEPQNPRERGFREVRRERECRSFLKPEYRQSKTETTDYVLPAQASSKTMRHWVGNLPHNADERLWRP